MGREVCRTVLGRAGHELAAAVDPAYAGTDLAQLVGTDTGLLEVSGSPEAMVGAGVEVAVDFTRIEAARANIEFSRMPASTW